MYMLARENYIYIYIYIYISLLKPFKKNKNYGQLLQGKATACSAYPSRPQEPCVC